MKEISMKIKEKPSCCYNIIQRESKKLAGTAYRDKWDNKLRLDMCDESGQREITEDYLEFIIQSKPKYTSISTNNPSNPTVKIYEQIIEYLCSKCEKSPMYDSVLNEYYCPNCEK